MDCEAILFLAIIKHAALEKWGRRGDRDDSQVYVSVRTSPRQASEFYSRLYLAVTEGIRSAYCVNRCKLGACAPKYYN